jgi:FkbM family methyltransferase
MPTPLGSGVVDHFLDRCDCAALPNTHLNFMRSKRMERQNRNAREVEETVTALYRTLLLRDPDEAGLKAHVDFVLSGQLTLPSLVDAICRSHEFSRNIDKFTARYAGNSSVRFTNDSSQFGEIDLLIRNMLNEVCRHRLIVDVGVLGKDGSNSYDLLRWFGWRGLLIEANPQRAEIIREEFADLNVELVSCAISDYTGTTRFYIGANDGVSSLNRHAAAGWGPIKGEIEVPVRRLSEILAERSIPLDFDVLSLDVEGEDIKVMNDLIENSSFRPRWVIIEASFNFQTKSLTDLPFLQSVVDEYQIFGQTPANLLLDRRSGPD